MAEGILGVDIAKKKFDVTLLVKGKLKHKVFTNKQEGFKDLSAWLRRQGVDQVHVCMEASSTYGGGSLPTSTMQGRTSVSLTLRASKDSPEASCSVRRTTRWMPASLPASVP